MAVAFWSPRPRGLFPMRRAALGALQHLGCLPTQEIDPPRLIRPPAGVVEVLRRQRLLLRLPAELQPLIPAPGEIQKVPSARQTPCKRAFSPCTSSGSAAAISAQAASSAREALIVPVAVLQRQREAPGRSGAPLPARCSPGVYAAKRPPPGVAAGSAARRHRSPAAPGRSGPPARSAPPARGCPPPPRSIPPWRAA